MKGGIGCCFMPDEPTIVGITGRFIYSTTCCFYRPTGECCGSHHHADATCTELLASHEHRVCERKTSRQRAHDAVKGQKACERELPAGLTANARQGEDRQARSNALGRQRRAGKRVVWMEQMEMIKGAHPIKAASTVGLKPLESDAALSAARPVLSRAAAATGALHRFSTSRWHLPGSSGASATSLADLLDMGVACSLRAWGRCNSGAR